jgi:hypothetical protein
MSSFGWEQKSFMQRQRDQFAYVKRQLFVFGKRRNMLDTIDTSLTPLEPTPTNNYDDHSLDHSALDESTGTPREHGLAAHTPKSPRNVINRQVSLDFIV